MSTTAKAKRDLTRRQVRLSRFLLTTYLLGLLFGYCGSHLRVIFREWEAADRLCRNGVLVESNAFELFGVSFARAPSAHASLLERTISRPTRVAINGRIDDKLVSQLLILRALTRVVISGEDASAFALQKVTRNARPQKIQILCYRHEDIDSPQLRRLPKL